MIWNPGEGTDLNEGGAGNDTVEVNGGNGAETFTVTANGTRVRFDRINPAPFSIDIGTTENLVVNMNGGDDTFTAGNGLAALIQITVDGGAGNDTHHRRRRQRHAARRRRQRLHRRRPRQRRRLPAAPATTRSCGIPATAATPSKARTATTRCCSTAPTSTRRSTSRPTAAGCGSPATSATSRWTSTASRTVNVNALGGADTVTVNDLSGTDVTSVNLDLAGTPGSGAATAQADTVIVNGTNGNDNISVIGAGLGFAWPGCRPP